jgi:asparagine synthase (glutamine-hydrolysing)
VARPDIDCMTERLAHRGPDGSGVWNEGSVGLGHRMLWTTPESRHERLPLTAQAGSVAITADARIDNRQELIAALALSDSRRQITDAELILGAYQRWGEDSPTRLMGDFAFAIWDGRRQSLFCARDHSGVKPFYYYQSDRILAFGSEIKALLSLEDVPRRLNQVKVADHLAGVFADNAITFYRDVFRLPPGHSLTVRQGETRARAYCGLDPSREIRLRSDDEYAEAFNERFTEAVRCRLRSTYPVGSLLSGGLDSSSIVVTARDMLGEGNGGPFPTFSAVFPSLPDVDLRRIDERPYMAAVVAAGGVSPHYVRADHLSPLTDLERVFWHEDEAVLAPNLYIHWALYGAAQEHGVRILLDGIDGDTTVSHGVEYLSELARRGRVGALGREVMALSRRHNSSPGRVLWQLGLRPLIPDSVRDAWRRVRGRSDAPVSMNTAIKPAFAEHVGLTERIRGPQAERRKRARTAREAHWRGLTSPLLAYALEGADKAAAAFGVEPRYPFFDRRLVEFCLALPPEQKLHRGWNRVVMRRAMAKTLPDEVRWRVGKANLSPNFKRRLLDHDRDVLEDVILRDPQVIEDYVDVAALREIYHRYASEPMSEKDALAVFAAVTLALWLRRTGLRE